MENGRGRVLAEGERVSGKRGRWEDYTKMRKGKSCLERGRAFGEEEEQGYVEKEGLEELMR